jgi:hypothetical protein
MYKPDYTVTHPTREQSSAEPGLKSLKPVNCIAFFKLSHMEAYQNIGQYLIAHQIAYNYY